MPAINLERFFTDMKVALSAGHPPMYVQMMLATMVFILVRLFFLFRTHRKNVFRVKQWTFFGYLTTLIILSFGTWETIASTWNYYGVRMLRLFAKFI